MKQLGRCRFSARILATKTQSIGNGDPETEECKGTDHFADSSMAIAEGDYRGLVRTGIILLGMKPIRYW
jgi:hypothetical protein